MATFSWMKEEEEEGMRFLLPGWQFSPLASLVIADATSAFLSQRLCTKTNGKRIDVCERDGNDLEGSTIAWSYIAQRGLTDN